MTDHGSGELKCPPTNRHEGSKSIILSTVNDSNLLIFGPIKITWLIKPGVQAYRYNMKENKHFQNR